MKKGYFYFGECCALSKALIIVGSISLLASAIFFFLGGWEVLTRAYAIANATFSIWCVFFLLIGIILFLINICIHKICRDIATLLKKLEDKKRD